MMIPLWAVVTLVFIVLLFTLGKPQGGMDFAAPFIWLLLISGYLLFWVVYLALTRS